MAKKTKKSINLIASNKKSSFDYFLEQHFQAGVALEGWELKSIRAGRVQLKESYVIFKKGEAYLFGCHISPLNSASTHVSADPVRTRKLLLHKKEIDTLLGAVNKKGYSVVPVNLHWKQHLVKVDIALGKGKKYHDKRASSKEQDWKRTKARMLKTSQD